jgi:pimeloyl-ACP methyl ester carboxylesterase
VSAPAEVAGPWEHAYVAANGARFHVAVAGPATGPAVVLLHGFPQFWWAWRHQVPVLAEAGHRVVAMDLRGYGGSDKTPRGYDPFTLAGDVAGVVQSLGLPEAALVGHGWGGYIAWATAVLHRAQVTSVATVSAPHPLWMLRNLRPGLPALGHVLAMQVPWVPERRLRDADSGYLANHLRAWSAPDATFPSAGELGTYQAALAQWPSPHCALEYHRWLVRSRIRDDGRRFNRAMREHVTVPSYTIFGGADPALPDPRTDRSQRWVDAAYRTSVLPGVGHFAPEEAPEQVGDLLRDWLATDGG